jgi:hypothetical protein
MFCDLVDSTRLSSQLDPEEYRDVVHAYQKVCTESSNAMKDILPNCSGMVFSSSSAIPKPMKMTLTEQYERAWVFSMP